MATIRAAPAQAGMATTACASCRRLKMKCVGSDNPPCARCAKVGRDCVVGQQSRGQQSQNQPSGAAQTDIIVAFQGSAPSTFRPEWPDYVPSPAELSQQTNHAALPSIYSNAPYSAVVENNDSVSPETRLGDELSPRGMKRRRTVSSEPFGTIPVNGNTVRAGNDEPISDRDMVQLIDLFRKRIQGFLPMIFATDLEDIRHTIANKRRLANCICFVTARFVPGGQSIRSKLYPTISEMLQDKSFLTKGDLDDEWTTLQALSVLYAYRLSITAPSTTDRSASPEEVPQWSIKAFVESYALHLSVHRSITGLLALLRNSSINITETSSYKKYIYWLWLFIMSHHYSVITGTPPTIREDTTIRMAPKILRDLNVGPRILQLLAEVELCLLWGKASAEEQGLGEWWCPPDLIDDLTSNVNLSVLDSVDASFDAWSQKWGTFMLDENFGPGIAFHHKFTKFCISTYLIRNLGFPNKNLSSSQQEAVRKSVDTAASFCGFGLDLGPLGKDTLRYMGDFGFVMVSFSCIFIVQACEIFGSTIPGIMQHLDTVEEIAHLMSELAINSNHGPSICGRSIIARLDKLHEAGIEPRDGGGIDNNEQARNYDQYPFGTQDELFIFDPLWGLIEFLS